MVVLNNLWCQFSWVIYQYMNSRYYHVNLLKKIKIINGNLLLFLKKVRQFCINVFK